MTNPFLLVPHGCTKVAIHTQSQAQIFFEGLTCPPHICICKHCICDLRKLQNLFSSCIFLSWPTRRPTGAAEEKIHYRISPISISCWSCLWTCFPQRHQPVLETCWILNFLYTKCLDLDLSLLSCSVTTYNSEEGGKSVFSSGCVHFLFIDLAPVYICTGPQLQRPSC